jgi:hypothetical protein
VLLAGSPAINAGDESVCAAAPVSNLDQPGYVRPGTGSTNCPIGAYGFNSPGSLSSCIGDCRGGDQLTVDDTLTMVDIARGNKEMWECESGDADNDGQITADDILIVVNNALNGCRSG